MSRPTAPIAATLAAALSGDASAQRFVRQTPSRFPGQAADTNRCTAVGIEGPDRGALPGNLG